jgi:mannose-6-phosphate isomerase-like protein (cupin superfamily)
MTPEIGYTITPLEPANPDDPRGMTYQWQFQDGMTQITLYERHAGQNFGQHYHNGDDLSKNPELLMLTSGEMEVTLECLDGETRTITLRPWQALTIWPNVKHSMRALTNVVIVEPRRTHFDPAKPDTVRC